MSFTPSPCRPLQLHSQPLLPDTLCSRYMDFGPGVQSNTCSMSPVSRGQPTCTGRLLCQNMVDYKNGHGFFPSPDSRLLAMFLWEQSHSSCGLGHVTCFGQ